MLILRSVFKLEWHRGHLQRQKLFCYPFCSLSLIFPPCPFFLFFPYLPKKMQHTNWSSNHFVCSWLAPEISLGAWSCKVLLNTHSLRPMASVLVANARMAWAEYDNTRQGWVTWVNSQFLCPHRSPYPVINGKEALSSVTWVILLHVWQYYLQRQAYIFQIHFYFLYLMNEG